MSYSLFVVTGAPGSGKSTAVEALLRLEHKFTVFDIDWLIDQGSELIGQPLQEAPNSWQAWAHLWFEVLHGVLRNGDQPVFFCPNSRADFEAFGLPAWCDQVNWLLLDCGDIERRSRLEQRGWSGKAISAAIVDAQELREEGFVTIDTSKSTKAQVADGILRWAIKKD